MKCKNCGTDVNLTSSFCPHCGTNLSDNESQNYQPNVCDALNRALSSTAFLVSCIILSATAFIQIFLFDNSGTDYAWLSFVLPILGVVFLWMTYVAANGSNLGSNSMPIRALRIISNANFAITWAVLGIYAVLCIFAASCDSSYSSIDTLQTILELLTFAVLLGSIHSSALATMSLFVISLLFTEGDSSYNIYSVLSCSQDDIILMAILFVALFAILNTIINKNFVKTAKSLVDTIDTGRNLFESRFAKIASFITAGIYVLIMIITNDSSTTEAKFVYLGYAGFMVSMAIVMSNIDQELSNVKSE